MDAIIYARQSIDRDGTELGVSRQLEDARQTAHLRGWTVLAEHVDNDTSASGKRRRPAFEAVLTDITGNRVKAVIAWDMTRLTRNRRDQVRLMEACEAAGATIALVRGSDIDTSTPSGRLVADLLASTARHETDVKADRQRRANLQAAQAGRRIGGRRPFGYEPDGETIREPEATALRQAYEAVLVGVPLGTVARAWNATGLHTPQQSRTGQPGQWRSSTLRVTMLNPRYAGLRALGRKDGRTRGEIIGPAVWPAIVPEQTWRAVEAILLGRSLPVPQVRRDRQLLTGIGSCGVEDCSGLVEVNHNRLGQRIYRCRIRPGHLARRVEPVNDYVSDLVVARLSQPDAADLLIDHSRPDVDKLRTEAETYRARLDQLANDFADGELTSSQLRTANERLRGRLAQIEQALADAGRVNVLGPIIGADNVQAAWDNLDTDRRRAVIDTLMSVRLLAPGRGVRTFRPETVQVEWKTGD